METLKKVVNSSRYRSFSQFLSSSFKGISQVLLIENAVTGFIIFIAITAASVEIGVLTMLSAIIGTGIGHVGGGNKSDIEQGLFGFNSVLTGLATSLYWQGDHGWVIALAAAAVAVFLSAAMMHFQDRFEISAFSFPFVICTWVILLSNYRIESFKFGEVLTPHDLLDQEIQLEDGTPHFFEGLMKGVGQVFLQDQFWVGVLILIGIFWASWKFGIYALLGSGVAWVTAYILGVDMHSLNVGLYSYNAVLVILAVSSVLDANIRSAPMTSIIATILTVPMTASINTLLIPYGIPALTMPFVLVTWLFHGARKVIPNI